MGAGKRVAALYQSDLLVKEESLEAPLHLKVMSHAILQLPILIPSLCGDKKMIFM